MPSQTPMLFHCGCWVRTEPEMLHKTIFGTTVFNHGLKEGSRQAFDNNYMQLLATNFALRDFQGGPSKIQAVRASSAPDPQRQAIQRSGRLSNRAPPKSWLHN